MYFSYVRVRANHLTNGTFTVKVGLQLFSDKPIPWSPPKRLHEDMLQMLESGKGPKFSRPETDNEGGRMDKQEEETKIIGEELCRLLYSSTLLKKGLRLLLA